MCIIVNWTAERTDKFFKAMKDNKSDFEAKDKKRKSFWEKIAPKVPGCTPTIAENKWKTVYDTYKKREVAKKKSGGRALRTWALEADVHAILCKKA